MDPSTMTGDEIVITGISGKFPNSENVKIFQENLLNMVDCVTNGDPRWTLGHPKIPERIGNMKDIDKFDATSFGINPKLVDVMDPMSRMSIEGAYEAIADSGNNPRQMKGKKCAVFAGSSITETEKAFLVENIDMSSFTLLGSAKTMIPNRISFFMGVSGPSITVDSLCTGSATALEEAYKLIKSGKVDSAIICGGNIVLHPETSLQFFHLGLLSPDGITRSFDNAANGYARSEAIVVFYLQRARDAKRIYAEIKGVRSMIGPSYDRNSALHPTCDFQTEIMKMTLKDSGISGKDVSFVEADGMGVKETDAVEVKAIDKVYNEGRKTPLLIGSVKSNVGSCSAANTMVAIVKVLTMMNSGFIPPNLHYKIPSENIPAIKDGRIEVVTKLTPWKGDYAAVNTTSIGGGFVSIILKSYKTEKKNGGQPNDDLPRLVTVSGGNEEAVAAILDDVESRPVDIEMLQLLNHIFEDGNPSHLYRGYSLLPSHGSVKSKLRDIQYSSGSKKQIWYLFSGMGSQWAGMGDAFMKLPVFAEAVRKCDVVLKPHGIDIIRIITEKDPKIFDNIINSFVGIATCQIGLVDLLTYFGIKPDFMIGHSVGELGCAYADGCFTAEQMVLSALSRGMASVESNLPRGSMAAVGLGYEDVKPLCPPDIDVACHNSSESSTISGPAETMKKFVADLTAKGIFAKEVSCSNIAFHSRYIAPAGAKLKEYLQKVIPNPRPRGVRWVSTSVPRNEWNSAKARLSSAEYHTNNLLGSVLFAETAKSIPSNAIVIEIAPHGLLQAIVKKSLREGVINVPLTKRGHPDNVEYMMAALGKIYNGGVNVNVSKLYPKVNYPVSCGTPSISSLIKWDHSKNWGTCFYVKPTAFKEGEITFKIDLSNDSWIFLKGNKIHNKIVLPCSLYLKLAWSVMENFSEGMDQPIIFENVIVHKIQNITEDEVLELTVLVQRGSGNFEVTSDHSLLCSGVLRKSDPTVQEKIQISNKFEKSEDELNHSDIYNELQMRGLQYSGTFRIIHKANANGSNGILVAQKEAIAFIDGMLQMYIFGNNLKTTQVPLKITKIIIDIKQFKEESQNANLVPVLVDQQLNVVHSGGVQLQGISLIPIARDSFKDLLIIEEIKISSAAAETVKTQLIPHVQKGRRVANWRACQIHPGDLNSIDWVEKQSFDNSDGNKIVKVEYSTIDESDFLLATGKMTSDDTNRGKDTKHVKSELLNFGLEYSGIDTKGRNVMGISESGTLSSITVPDPELIWLVPKSWDLQDAATVPLAYATSYMALYLKGKIKKKKSVLIYDSTSTLGQALINLTLSEECDVFASYASNDEKAFLKKLYPAISEDRLFHLKYAFENEILSATKGVGVDLIIYNSSSLNKINSCLVCAKAEARVILLGNLLKAFRVSVGMNNFMKEIALYSIIPKNVIDADINTKQKLSAMINDGIRRGVVKPLFSNLYSREALRKAFTDSGNKSSRKIVVKVQPENSTEGALVTSHFLFSNKRSYLIIDDLSMFGLVLVNFLIARGEKQIFIASAGKNSKTLFNYRTKIWQESGAQVILREDLDFSEQDNVRKLLSEASKLNPIDVIFDLQRLEISSERTSSSKYLFTKNLVEESKKICANLRQFFVLSTLKSADQNLRNILLKDINVAKLCQDATRDGLPATLIFWSPIEEIAESNILKERKIPLLTISECVEQLENLIGLNIPVVFASSSKSIISRSQKNDTENKAIQEKDERTLFQEYLYTNEGAGAKKLINFLNEDLMVQLQD